METIKIKNTTENTYRFNGIITFRPGEVTEIAKEDIKRLPNIQTLLDRGDFELVKSKGRKAADDDVIEEA